MVGWWFLFEPEGSKLAQMVCRIQNAHGLNVVFSGNLTSFFTCSNITKLCLISTASLPWKSSLHWKPHWVQPLSWILALAARFDLNAVFMFLLGYGGAKPGAAVDSMQPCFGSRGTLPHKRTSSWWIVKLFWKGWLNFIFSTMHQALLLCSYQ